MNRAAMPADVVAEAAAAAGAYLRLSEADAVMGRAAASACALAEAFCGQRLFARGTEEVIGTGGGWQRLTLLPVRSIAGVVGLPAEGAPFVLPVASYAIDVDANGIGWVRVIAPGAAGRVAVSYAAGLATGWSDLPAPVAQGVVLLAVHLFEHREGGGAPPAAVAALWRPYRRMRLCGECRGGECRRGEWRS